MGTAGFSEQPFLEGGPRAICLRPIPHHIRKEEEEEEEVEEEEKEEK